MPAETYLLDGLGLYVLGVTEKMSKHHKAIAKRVALLANHGKITRKSDAVDGRETGGVTCGGVCGGPK